MGMKREQHCQLVPHVQLVERHCSYDRIPVLYCERQDVACEVDIEREEKKVSEVVEDFHEKVPP